MNAWIIAQQEWLAQLPQTSSARIYSENDVLTWGGILIGVVLIGSVFIMLLRRRLRDSSTPTGDDAGFSLSDLRAMRDRGEITPEEFEQTRAKVIAKVKKKADEPPKSKPEPLGETPTDTEG
jgi:hypothetical protein